MNGTVTFTSGKGWFYILSDDDRSVFVHQNAVVGQYFLRPGDRVAFGEIIESPTHPGKLQGNDVRLLGRNIARQVGVSRAEAEKITFAQVPAAANITSQKTCDDANDRIITSGKGSAAKRNDKGGAS
jgi:cold shock CspA family protein